jgi:hypothetical protein
MMVKIDPENPDCFWGGAPHWRKSEKLPVWGKPDFLQPAAALGRANL